ncbi:hypothetical protein RHMOL_Rhmol07G0269900 [Rhododendron molle]|uniref:Uncharacterized protein n=1 Tax=Rhododendron molle TaxID=49168 RepID=A0ACC0N730_RHOML|nr:hypothetical protein RHMOL_Rhmol07G0269900 [Rhododendron molle]
MPIGRDLGFPYLVVFLVLVGQVVIGFLVRRRWRRSAGRREEIKRLLVMAAEEEDAARAEEAAAARAELEASAGYASNLISAPYASSLISAPLQYQCAVCFSPTTTRCARCKSIRYWYGEISVGIIALVCDILGCCDRDWNLVKPLRDSLWSLFMVTMGRFGENGLGILRKRNYSSGKCQIVHWRQGHKEECRLFTSSHESNEEGGSYQKVLKQEERKSHDNSIETNEKERNFSLHEKERSDKHQSTNVLPKKLEASCMNNVDENGQPRSKGTVFVDSTNCPTSSGKLNQIKPECADEDSQGDSTSSSGWTADGSNESLFSGPSTPSSGFSEGTIDSSKPKVDDALDDSAESASIGADDANLQNSQSLSFSSKFHRNTVPPVVEQCSDTKTVKLDDLYSSEPRYCSSSTYANPNSGAGGPSISTDTLKVSSIRSVIHEKSSHSGNDTGTTSRLLGSRDDKSSACAEQTNPGKVGSAQATATTEYANCSPNGRNGVKTCMQKVVGQLRASKGSEMTGRYTTKGLFPYELFVKLYNWNKVELQPFGLSNCGNSCYANAVLQCLACTPPLTAYLLQGLHRKACERKGWCFTCEFESLILKAKEGTSPLSPMSILAQIQNIGSHLGNGKEEDAHEFLRYAIDAMQSVCLKEAGVSSGSCLEEETSLIGLTFGGYLRSKIKCLKCGGKSERHERMMDLTVEIEGDIGTLEEALGKFTGTEILDGENKYQCTRCRSYERAKKKLTVQEAPNILTIALKRFQSGKFGKLNKPIKFPEILNLAPYMSGTSDKSPVYRLFGVVVHLDIMNAAFSGHYVCYIKNGQKKWFKIDDTTVIAVELESVLTKRAYMLLYARCSPRAPRVIRNSIIPLDPVKPKHRIFKSKTNPTSSWDASTPNPLSGHTGIECIRANHMRKILEEDSLSENSSSLFSEECSCCSSESSNKDSATSDDYDHLFIDRGRDWKNSSDSDSTSSDSDQNSPKYPSTNAIRIRNVESDIDRNGFWGRLPDRSSDLEGKSSGPLLNSDIQCRNFSQL